MRFYEIKPEGVGGVGPGTLIDKSDRAHVRTTALNFQFQFFPNDDVVYCPWAICMVTDTVAKALGESGLTGFTLKKTTVSVDEQAHMWWKRKVEDLPEFTWLRFKENAFADDFGTPDGIKMIVSERALELLKKFSISKMEITEAVPPK